MASTKPSGRRSATRMRIRGPPVAAPEAVRTSAGKQTINMESPAPTGPEVDRLEESELLRYPKRVAHLGTRLCRASVIHSRCRVLVPEMRYVVLGSGEPIAEHLLRGDLLHHLQPVALSPSLCHPAVLDPQQVDAGERDLPVGCRHAELVALMGARSRPSHGHLVVRCDDVVAGEAEVR